MKSKVAFTLITLTLILLFVSACTKPEAANAPTSVPTEALTEEPAAPNTAPPAETSAPTEAPTPSLYADVTALPPEPRIITITTEDNFTLTGYYYPANVNPAPLVVLYLI